MTKIDKLKKAYNKAMQNYIDFFSEKQGIDCQLLNEYWVNMGDMTISFSDVIYDVDNEVPEGKIIEYFDYTLERYMHNENPDNAKLQVVNYPSFVKGLR